MIACEGCGFGVVDGMRTHSAEWHEAHRVHHLATYPDLDFRSRDNLAMIAERARQIEAEGRAS